MHAPVGLVVLNAMDLTVSIANACFLKMFGCREDDIAGRPLFEMIPDIEPVAAPLIRDVSAKRLPGFRNEVAIRTRRKSTALYNVVCHPISREEQVDSIMLIVTEAPVISRRRPKGDHESLYRQVVAQSPAGMAILKGPELVIDIANDAILKSFWHRRAGEVEGRKLFEVFPELTAQSFPEIFADILRTGQPYQEREKFVYIDRSPCNYIDLHVSVLRGRGDDITGLLLTVYDVSDKVSARKKTEANEERLRMVLEASGLGIWELNLKTKEFKCSDELLANFGVNERHTHGQLLRFMHPGDMPVRQQAFHKALATGWLHYVARLIWPDQSIHWIEVHGKVVYNDKGEPARMMGTTRDITAERLYQKSLQESEVKFRLLADSMPQFVWTSDPKGNLNYFNLSVFDYSGMTHEQLEGQGWVEIVHPDDRAAHDRKWGEAVRKGGSFHLEHRFRRHDGMYRWLLSRAIPQYDTHGRISMWVGTSTDIHDQKTFAQDLEEKVFERTRELKETNEVLEKTNRELEQFAYIASHDLQEPLRKILTFSDILKRNISNETLTRKYFQKIDSSARRMAELIKAVLDYSRLPAHPGQLRLTDLNEIIKNVRTDLELTIADKKAVIRCDSLPAVPGVPLQIHQLFSNLIGNALKFTSGEPRITISSKAVHGSLLTQLCKADPTKQYVELRFRDNGIGFDNRYREQIFTIFQRLHGWQQYSGTGIGLALCKKIVENHHGYITAEGEPGRGATFIVYLPA